MRQNALKIGDKVKVKSIDEVMEIDNIFDDGDVLVGIWDSGCRMVKVIPVNDVEFVVEGYEIHSVTTTNRPNLILE